MKVKAKREMEERAREALMILSGIPVPPPALEVPVGVFRFSGETQPQPRIRRKGRLKDYEERAKLAVAGGAKIEHASQTVPVRAHFRAIPNHLGNDAALLALVEQVVRRVMAEQKKARGA